MINVIIVLISVLFAVWCHKLAKTKQRQSVFWGTLGLLFGPFAVIVLLILKTKPIDTKHH
ncbi:MAG: hypothetical protein U9R28_00380 [Pseudomonadota bacterium]|nr:hypothetical protein [Pseudomonadota bacterium]